MILSKVYTDLSQFETSSSPIESPNSLSVITWNLDGLDSNNRLERISAAISILNKLHADVIFLQGVVDEILPCFESMRNTYDVNCLQVDILSKEERSYYTMVLTRKAAIHRVKEEYHQFRNSIMKRGLQILETSFGDQRVFLLNTHLESLEHFALSRKWQFDFIFEKIRNIQVEYPDSVIILGGDFNVENNELIPPLPDGFSDAWFASGADPSLQYTWDSRTNDNKKDTTGEHYRFDRILFSESLRISTFKLEGKGRISTNGPFPSDHFAVRCVFST